MPKFPSAALAVLCFTITAPAAAQPAAMVVQVYSFGFGPHPIQLAAGRPVTLTFVNQSSVGHDFTAKLFFSSSTITAGAAPGGEIDLSDHQSRSITLTPRAGTYEAHCSHFLHRQMGMTDEIVVN